MASNETAPHPIDTRLRERATGLEWIVTAEPDAKHPHTYRLAGGKGPGGQLMDIAVAEVAREFDVIGPAPAPVAHWRATTRDGRTATIETRERHGIWSAWVQWEPTRAPMEIAFSGCNVGEALGEGLEFLSRHALREAIVECVPATEPTRAELLAANARLRDALERVQSHTDYTSSAFLIARDALGGRRA